VKLKQANELPGVCWLPVTELHQVGVVCIHVRLRQVSGWLSAYWQHGASPCARCTCSNCRQKLHCRESHQSLLNCVQSNVTELNWTSLTRF